MVVKIGDCPRCIKGSIISYGSDGPDYCLQCGHEVKDDPRVSYFTVDNQMDKRRAENESLLELEREMSTPGTLSGGRTAPRHIEGDSEDGY